LFFLGDLELPAVETLVFCGEGMVALFAFAEQQLGLRPFNDARELKGE
jgi:hypothetical protein